MSKIFQKDIISIFILTLISILCLLIPSLNKFTSAIILYVLILFFLPGYSLIIALYPENNRAIMKILMAIPTSIIILSLFELSINYIKISSKTILLILALITLLFAGLGYLRRYRSYRKTDKYLVCESCGGYYRLEKGDSPYDFESCSCGGKLRYAKNKFMSKDELKRKKIDNKTYNEPKTVTHKYIICENCGGYYKLKKGETLEDFGTCKCGGKLKYAGAYFKPEKDKKKSKYKKIPKDIPFIIILIALTILVVNVSSVSTSIIRSILVLPLLIFLSGYSLTKAVMPHLSWFKIILSSFTLSIILTFSLSLLFSSSALKVSPAICILVIAATTIILLAVSYIREPKLTKMIEKHSKVHDTYLRSKIRNANEKSQVKYINSKFMPADIFLVWLAAVLCVIFVLTPILNDTVFRSILGLLLILFAPGYTLIATLFPKNDDLDGIERIALSFGISIAISSLIGLILNYTPFGIRVAPLLIALSIFIILTNTTAYIRRQKLREEEMFNVNFKYYFGEVVKSFKNESKTDKILSIVLVLFIILGVFGTAYVIVVPNEGEKFTEFYILGPNGNVSDYPVNLTIGQPGNVKIGIVNYEYSTVNYKMMVKLNNQTICEKNITLTNNQTYLEPFTFVPSNSGQHQEIEFLLYKLPDENNAYRSLHLWINVR